MSREIRSRRAGMSRDEARQQPLYARMLGLQYVSPSGLLCFVFLEGAVAMGVLLALAELVSWWGVLALPATVAVMVKLNDVVAGALSRPTAVVRRPPALRAVVHFAEADVVHPVGAGDQVPPWRALDGATPLSFLPAGSSPVVRRAAVRPVAARPAMVDPGPQAVTRVNEREPDRLTGDGTYAGRGADTGSVNGPPVARQWGTQAEKINDLQQGARQAASRRYE